MASVLTDVYLNRTDQQLPSESPPFDAVCVIRYVNDLFLGATEDFMWHI